MSESASPLTQPSVHPDFRLDLTEPASSPHSQPQPLHPSHRSFIEIGTNRWSGGKGPTGMCSPQLGKASEEGLGRPPARMEQGQS